MGHKSSGFPLHLKEHSCPALFMTWWLHGRFYLNFLVVASVRSEQVAWEKAWLGGDVLQDC